MNYLIPQVTSNVLFSVKDNNKFEMKNIYFHLIFVDSIFRFIKINSLVLQYIFFKLLQLKVKNIHGAYQTTFQFLKANSLS